jgi:hypothetical protein
MAAIVSQNPAFCEAAALKKQQFEAVPKLQFWNSNLRFRACSVANKVCALTEFWNRLGYHKKSAWYQPRKAAIASGVLRLEGIPGKPEFFAEQKMRPNFKKSS